MISVFEFTNVCRCAGNFELICSAVEVFDRDLASMTEPDESVVGVQLG